MKPLTAADRSWLNWKRCKTIEESHDKFKGIGEMGSFVSSEQENLWYRISIDPHGPYMHQEGFDDVKNMPKTSGPLALVVRSSICFVHDEVL